MKCNQPNVKCPVDFEGKNLNVKIDSLGKKVWVCIDGDAVFRAQHLDNVTIEDDRSMFEKEKLDSVLERQAEKGNSLLSLLQGTVARLEEMSDVAKAFSSLLIVEGDSFHQLLDDTKAYIEEFQVAGLFREMIVKVQRPISTNDFNMEPGVCLVYTEDQSLNQFIQIGQAMEWFQNDFNMYVKVRLWNDGVLQLLARVEEQSW